MFSFDGISFWKLLAGLGIFLFGMSFLEKALNKLIGRNFKKFLRQNTESTLKAVFGGTVATVLLQSSSIVGLMLLAFVSTGVIKLRSAINIMSGANLGSTFNGWLFVMLGFNAGTDVLAYVFISLGALLTTGWFKPEKFHQLGSFFMGFGFLFLGLGFMKGGIGSMADLISLKELAASNYLIIFFAGLCIAAVIHSSSAITAVALSAVHAGIIPVEAAAVLIIGSDLGTTMTIVVGAIGSSAVKKRLASCNVLFNLFTALLAFFILHPVLWWSEHVLQINDELYRLVLFHSIFNLAGILVMVPLSGVITAFLESRFNGSSHQVTTYIGSVPASMPELAMDALSREIQVLADRVINLNRAALGMGPFIPRRNGVFRPTRDLFTYDKIKALEGKIVEYHVMMQGEKMKTEELSRLNQYMYAVRNLISSAKELKGVTGNIKDFCNSSNDTKQQLVTVYLEKERGFYTRLLGLVKEEQLKHSDLSALSKTNREIYNGIQHELYREVKTGAMSETEISTFLNINHETFNANKALITAMVEIFCKQEEPAEVS